MNKNQKKFKSFYILNNLQGNFDYSWLVNASFGKESTVGKIGYIESRIDNELHEIDFVWEKTEIVINEELNEELEIVESKQVKKSVERLSIWYFEHKPFLFIFTNKVSVIKELLSFFVPDFDFSPSLIRFNNKFFKEVINRDFESEISEVSFQSGKSNQKYVISGKSVEQSNFIKTLKSNNEIVSITLSFFDAFSIKAKISKSGRITLYNLPESYEVITFINLIKDLIIEVGEDGLSYENI